jgi:hypothetical protein
MGLCATAKGLDDETGFECGYLTYGHFLMNLAEAAYGQQMGAIYKNNEFLHGKWSESDIEYWDKQCNDDIDILLFHSDCDGKFTPQECRRIYNAIKDLKMDMVGHNYGVMKNYNMLEHWKNIFYHCAKRRVNLYYS